VFFETNARAGDYIQEKYSLWPHLRVVETSQLQKLASKLTILCFRPPDPVLEAQGHGGPHGTNT
jgi:hypothetical protein